MHCRCIVRSTSYFLRLRTLPSAGQRKSREWMARSKAGRCIFTRRKKIFINNRLVYILLESITDLLNISVSLTRDDLGPQFLGSQVSEFI